MASWRRGVGMVNPPGSGRGAIEGRGGTRHQKGSLVCSALFSPEEVESWSLALGLGAGAGVGSLVGVLVGLRMLRNPPNNSPHTRTSYSHCLDIDNADLPPAAATCDADVASDVAAASDGAWISREGGGEGPSRIVQGTEVPRVMGREAPAQPLSPPQASGNSPNDANSEQSSSHSHTPPHSPPLPTLFCNSTPFTRFLGARFPRYAAQLPLARLQGKQGPSTATNGGHPAPRTLDPSPGTLGVNRGSPPEVFQGSGCQEGAYRGWDKPLGGAEEEPGFRRVCVQCADGGVVALDWPVEVDSWLGDTSSTGESPAETQLPAGSWLGEGSPVGAASGLTAGFGTGPSQQGVEAFQGLIVVLVDGSGLGVMGSSGTRQTRMQPADMNPPQRWAQELVNGNLRELCRTLVAHGHAPVVFNPRGCGGGPVTSPRYATRPPAPVLLYTTGPVDHQ